MIRRLRNKLIIVLMTFLSLLLVAILAGMFFSAKLLFERRNDIAFSDPPPAEDSSDRSLRLAIPIAAVTMDATGKVMVTQNQIRYVSDEELLRIAESLNGNPISYGNVSAYDLRYRRHVNTDGTVEYLFSDTFLERDSLKAQVLSSLVIGIGALTLFLVVSVLLSRWMVKPVERAWEKQRQFVTDASHELKTPLTVILSNTDMMIESGAVTDEKNRMRLDNIRAESKRMKALTESLLNLARADSRKKTGVKETVNFSFVLSGAALMFEPAVFDLDRSITCEIQENVFLLGDQDKLRRLADILIDNAIKYGAQKSPILVGLTVNSKKEALFSVVSEGMPLSPKERAHVFERFYRVDTSRGQTTGFGLGLSIARSIVDEFGGKIWAESDGVKRNAFLVKFPVKTFGNNASGQG
ncbi:MAG: HAMP domain-containing sensor histidine kinase [Bacillota bacterium]